MKITLNENSTIAELKAAEKFLGEKVIAGGQEWDENNGPRDYGYVYIVRSIDTKERHIDGDIIDPNSGKLICENQRIGNFCADWEVTDETVEDSNYVAPEYTAIVYDCNGDKSHFDGKNKKGILKEIGEWVNNQVEYMGQCTIELTKRGEKEISDYKLPAGRKTAILMGKEDIVEW